MKIAVREDKNTGELFYYSMESTRISPVDKEFLGYIDLPIEKPKKVVTKEAGKIETVAVLVHDGGGYTYPVYAVPSNAKNVRCTYEIEE